MVVTDGKFPARLKDCADMSVRVEDAPGGPRRPQEAPGAPGRSQEASGGPRRFHEAPGGIRRPKETPQGPRRPRGGLRRPSKAPGSPRRPQEAPGGPRKPQGASGGPRPEAPGARRIGARKACPAPEKERNFSNKCARRARATFRCFARGVGAASHSCHTFCDVDDRTSMLKGKTLILYCLYSGRTGGP